MKGHLLPALFILAGFLLLWDQLGPVWGSLTLVTAVVAGNLLAKGR